MKVSSCLTAVKDAMKSRGMVPADLVRAMKDNHGIHPNTTYRFLGGGGVQMQVLEMFFKELNLELVSVNTPGDSE